MRPHEPGSFPGSAPVASWCFCAVLWRAGFVHVPQLLSPPGAAAAAPKAGAHCQSQAVFAGEELGADSAPGGFTSALHSLGLVPLRSPGQESSMCPIDTSRGRAGRGWECWGAGRAAGGHLVPVGFLSGFRPFLQPNGSVRATG